MIYYLIYVCEKISRFKLMPACLSNEYFFFIKFLQSKFSIMMKHCCRLILLYKILEVSQNSCAFIYLFTSQVALLVMKSGNDRVKLKTKYLIQIFFRFKSFECDIYKRRLLLRNIGIDDGCHFNVVRHTIGRLI